MRGRRGNSGWVVKQIKYIFRKKDKKELTLESEVVNNIQEKAFSRNNRAGTHMKSQ